MSHWQAIIEDIFPKSRGWARWLGNERGNLGQSTSQQTQTRNVAPASGAELALQNTSVPAMQQQTGTLQDAIARMNAYQAGPAYANTLQLGNVATQNLLNRISGTGGGLSSVISPAAQSLVDQIYAGQQDQALRALQTQAQNAASQRGLALTDTAINYPYMQSVKDLESNIAGQKAQALLNFGAQDTQFQQALMQYSDSQRAAQQQQGLAFSQAQPPGYQYGLQLGQQRLNAAPVSTSGTSNAPWTQGLAYLGSAIGGRNGLWDPAVGPGRGLFSGGSGTPGQPGYSAPGLLRPAVDAAGNFISSGAKDMWGGIFGGGTSGAQPGYQMPSGTYGGSSYSLGPQGNYAPDASLSDTSSGNGGDSWDFT